MLDLDLTLVRLFNPDDDDEEEYKDEDNTDGELIRRVKTTEQLRHTQAASLADPQVVW